MTALVIKVPPAEVLANRGDFAVVELELSCTYAFGSGRGTERWSRFEPCVVTSVTCSGMVKAMRSLIDGRKVALDGKGRKPWTARYGVRLVAADKIRSASELIADMQATFGEFGAPSSVDPLREVFARHKA